MKQRYGISYVEKSINGHMKTKVRDWFVGLQIDLADYHYLKPD
jgi:hypothetical protein